MGLPWIRLDSDMPANPKIRQLIEDHRDGMAAGFAWVSSICYSARHGHDGFISRSWLDLIKTKAIHARLLAEHNFWIPDGTGGWNIHDYADYQPSTAETKQRSERARELARRRWDRHRPP